MVSLRTHLVKNYESQLKNESEIENAPEGLYVTSQLIRRQTLKLCTTRILKIK